MDTSSSYYYNIDYSVDNGQSWVNIVTNYYTTSGQYDWLVPNISTNNGLIRITDYVDNCKTDQTDQNITISNTSVLTITYPNGNEQLTGCNTETITWNDNGSSGTYNLKYSTDNGQNWNSIQNSFTSSSNSYNWNVPNIQSANCLVRIEDAFNLNDYYDHSNSMFSIDTLFKAQISASGPLQICSGDTLVLTSNFTSGNSWTPNGESTPSIYVTQAGVYGLTVNNMGCSSEADPITVILIQPPVAPNISPSGPTTFCQGGSVTLTSSSNTGNYWLPNGVTSPSITVNTSGTYFVMVSQNGCSSTSNSINVTVNSLPPQPNVYSNSPVPHLGTLNLSTDNVVNTTFEWNGPNNFISTLQNPSLVNMTSNESGVYSLKLFSNNCWGPPTYHTVQVGSPMQTVNVSGTITNSNNDPINKVNISATDGNTIFTSVTDSNGNYNLDVGQYYTYTLTPSKTYDSIITNGISTLDLILIQSHILGNNALTDPFKILAADVNMSSSVSTLDIVLIRRLILNIASSYPNNDKWIFVDSDFNFPNPLSPFSYPNYKTISSGNNLNNISFDGVKLGDVSGDWDYTLDKTGSTIL